MNTLLIAGLVIFFLIHAVPSRPLLKTALVARFGANGYKGGFSLLAALGLVLIVWGMASRTFVPVWTPPGWGYMVPPILMLPALILLAAANMPTNIKRFTRHPMLWGIILWSGAHLLANGDQASLILFGSFGIFALLDRWSANRRGATKSQKKLPFSRDLMVIVGGSVVYLALVWAHPYLMGVPAFR